VQARIHADRINWTCLNAVPAVNAQQGIDFIAMGELFNLRIIVFGCLNINALGWASCCTQKAGRTLDVTIFMQSKTVPTSKSSRIIAPFLWVLNTCSSSLIFTNANQMQYMQYEVANKATEGDVDSLHYLYYIHTF
jgi:hypothetical protein